MAALVEVRITHVEPSGVPVHPMTRLSESTLPLTQISLDSVHEKNVRHGHLSTLHIWPARRPLAASRAMILATLLPDPGDTKSRWRLGTRMAGRLVPKARQ